MTSVEVVSQDEERISVKLKGIPLQYANALRRICLNGVPVFAIDSVDVVENSSVLADEGLAHRLGLIPLRTDLSEFKDASDVGQDDQGRVMLTLDSGETTQTRTIFSNELTSEDSHVRPSSEKIPIVQLATDQRIKIEAYAKLGRGLDHAKWNSSNISVLAETGKDDERLLTVESTGAVAPAQIVLAGISELSGRVAEFRKVLDGLE